MIVLSGKRVAVVGLGVSGLAAARLAMANGAHLTLTDMKSEDALGAEVREQIARLVEAGARLSLGGHSEAELERQDLVVVSPGVPVFAELRAAEERQVPVIGEVELAVRVLSGRAAVAPVVAVGGTNGKSTTTSLLGAILETAGQRAFVGGNLGEPLSDHVDEIWDSVVLEVSSFQLERVEAFKPKVSILLNVTADHLDRYPSFDAYARAKGNAFARQSADDVAVVPYADEVCLREARRGRGRVVTFGRGGDVDITSDSIVDRKSGASFARAPLQLSGEHNAVNAAAAIAAALALGVSHEHIRVALASFRGLPHRMVLVDEINGVRYYDDSKGTNVGAAVTALLGLSEPRAVLIAGGREKGGSYAPLADALREKGRAVVLLGEAQAAMAGAFVGAAPVHSVASLADAVRLSHSLAHPGDAVLLSPACSSYDMFRDYKHRGDEFVREVSELPRSGRRDT